MDSTNPARLSYHPIIHHRTDTTRLSLSNSTIICPIIVPIIVLSQKRGALHLRAFLRIFRCEGRARIAVEYSQGHREDDCNEQNESEDSQNHSIVHKLWAEHARF